MTRSRFTGVSTGARDELFGKVGTRKAQLRIIAESSEQLFLQVLIIAQFFSKSVDYSSELLKKWDGRPPPWGTVRRTQPPGPRRG